MAVTRCVCHDVSFAELKRLCAETGPDIDALAARTGCGTGCGTCIPYILLMLRTGHTDLPVLSGAQVQAIFELAKHDMAKQDLAKQDSAKPPPPA